MKRIAAMVLAFAASLWLIDCAASCAAQGDTDGYLGAFLCGVALFAVVIILAAVSLSWEREMDRENRRRRGE